MRGKGGESKRRSKEREWECTGGWIDEGYGSIRVTLVCLWQQRCSWQTEQKQDSRVTWFPFTAWGKGLVEQQRRWRWGDGEQETDEREE